MKHYMPSADGRYPEEVVDECLRAAVVDVAKAGMICTQEEIVLAKRCLLGEIGKEEYIAEALKLAKKIGTEKGD